MLRAKYNTGNQKDNLRSGSLNSGTVHARTHGLKGGGGALTTKRGHTKYGKLTCMEIEKGERVPLFLCIHLLRSDVLGQMCFSIYSIR